METKLTLVAEATGTQKAASELQKVADAQGAVSASVDATAKMAEAAQPALQGLADAEKRLAELRASFKTAQESGTVGEVLQFSDAIEKQQVLVDRLSGAKGRLTASERDWMGTLRQISPALGGFIDDTIKAAKVSKELGDQKKLLSSVGSLAIPVFIAIAGAVRAMAQEFIEATKAIREQAKALDELKSKEREQQQGIEDIRAGSKLPVFTAEESQAALQAFQKLQERFPFIDKAAGQRAVAFTGGEAGLPGGGAFGLEEIARLARLIQTNAPTLKLDEAMPTAAVEREIKRELARNRERLDQEFSREDEQQRERRSRAVNEVAQEGGSTLNLKERLARRAPAGMDIGHLSELVQKLQDVKGLEEFSRLLEMAISGESPSLHVLRRLSQGAGLLGIDAGAIDPRLTATEAELAVIRGVFAELVAEMRRNTEAVLQATEMADRTPRSVTYNQQNAKHFGPDAASMQARTRNGESLRNHIER